MAQKEGREQEEDLSEKELATSSIHVIEFSYDQYFLSKINDVLPKRQTYFLKNSNFKGNQMRSLHKIGMYMLSKL